jgi:catechol 2,3-dioxygenase-like lactoylglutathione lyase family enzyme
MTHFSVKGFDHIVLCVRDVEATRTFYTRVLGMEAREERPGKWSLHFGEHKISLQHPDTAPIIAKDTLPGTGNFCVISATPVAEWREHLDREGIEVVASGPKDGAVGPIESLYFNDPDGNLVEVSNRL